MRKNPSKKFKRERDIPPKGHTTYWVQAAMLADDDDDSGMVLTAETRKEARKIAQEFMSEWCDSCGMPGPIWDLVGIYFGDERGPFHDNEGALVEAEVWYNPARVSGAED